MTEQPQMDQPDGGETLVGILDHITFQDPESGFLIGRLMGERSREPVTIKGNLFNVSEGQTVKVWGAWEEHRTFGTQFRVDAFLVVEPTSLVGMERFLISSVSGVGQRTAERIVKAFGLKTFEVLDREPERLLSVPKVSRKVVKSIEETWAAHKAVREIMVFLHGLGISQGYAERIFRTYQYASVEVLKDNPYRLATDVRGIGFRIADAIARKVGVGTDDPKRADAGVLYTLDELAGEGHTGYPRQRLLARSAEMLGLSAGQIAAAIDRLVGDGLVKQLPTGDGKNDEPFYLRPRYYHAEGDIAESLERIMAAPLAPIPHLAQKLETLERESGIYLDPEQQAAVRSALEHKVAIITGGPGTGKTTIIRFILGLAGETLDEVALAAPTGKAAKRMEEATGHNASTIHRLLEARGEGFKRGLDRPVDADLVIIDESSMIDTLLMRALLEAIPDQARLVLVGDVDQLPSVGAGMVLEDLITSGRLPVLRLEKIHRQSRASRITRNAHEIRKGQPPDLSVPAGEDLTDFYFMHVEDPERIVARILELVTDRIPQRFGFDPGSGIQVISPMRRGLTGVNNLNRALQQALNPGGQEIGAGDPPLRVGDRVLQTRNNYDKDVFNGDMGEIRDWNEEKREASIAFDERLVKYPRKDLDQLALGYAITVHKAQGSEYPAVVLPFTTHHAIMLQRNLLYTAITRGKGLVVILGTEKAIGMAVRNARRDERFTRLKARLLEALPHHGPQG